MRVSELTKKLFALMTQHGDIEVEGVIKIEKGKLKLSENFLIKVQPQQEELPRPISVEDSQRVSHLLNPNDSTVYLR
jgi:hypothetical protein